MNIQPIYNLAEICHRHGIKDVILSPGSRCAPLTLAFARHPEIECKTISDERSAAFIGLGMSQQTKLPTALVCTSGSAALNYAPAIAEAYFQHIPLLVLTADRPPEWIDQYDGQTIRQRDIYGKHVKESYQLPVDLENEESEWHCYRMLSEAINTSLEYPAGPVHINLPFREPFYPQKDQITSYNKAVKVITQTGSRPVLPESELKSLIDRWQNTQRKLIIGGQGSLDDKLASILEQLSATQKVPIIGDILSNLHQVDEVIAHSDVFLGQGKKGLAESLQPNLIVTFGKSTISKNLKLFLRNHPAVEHWHIQPAGSAADTFKSLTEVLHTTPEIFFSKLVETPPNEDFNTQKQENFYHLWVIEERKVRRVRESFFPQESLGEFEIVNEILEKTTDAHVHLANSMAVRYANFIGLNPNQSVEVFSNRGTSGIDGCTSTAVGSSMASQKTTILITGDVAFFYDRNAFWHNYDLKHLKIVLLNNHAGGIFRMIQGPADQPELEEFFETRQTLSAKHLAEEFKVHYINCDKRSKLKNQIKEFFESSGPVILEIESDSQQNKEILASFKEAYRLLD
ncbi:2-succinyl-5-enolpyruvyl-6-hydroxy-3-cyclohexene-1-carboxylic-acid synthase [Fulvivirga sp. RKSG066]|nr:2-succinyl-5-enolpyruvyl-6-hydroxy-3-cyclohexene-1-carboxylic-acid synthase [Fulvivirga aurantia]MTI22790.1 2-succinyl-5-enolpyruvyl-6-hydroxy-3-cyclohexene-1-carboxylic-acid synthase [Fulvivirga aurantia]